jgi:hypothetical protein
VLYDDDQADVTCPGKDSGDSSGCAAAGVTEPGSSDPGDQAGIPVHAVHQLPQDEQPAGPFVSSPVLGVDEILDDLPCLALVDQDTPALRDEVSPAGVRSEVTGVDAGAGPVAAVGASAGERARCRSV